MAEKYSEVKLITTIIHDTKLVLDFLILVRQLGRNDQKEYHQFLP